MCVCISVLLYANISRAYDQTDSHYWYDVLMFDDVNSSTLVRKFNMGETPSVSIMDIGWFMNFYSLYDGEAKFPESIMCDDTDYKIVSTENYCFYRLFQKEHGALELPSGLRYLGSFNFYDFYLNRLELPDNLEVISSNSFSHGSIDEIVFGKTLNRIDNSCFITLSISSISFNNSLRSIGSSSFVNLEKLKELILPESLKKVGTGCFTNIKSLEFVSLPKSSANLALVNCFNACPNIKVIECASEVAPSFSNSFVDVNKDECIVKVPVGCKDAYLSSELWKDFRIEEADIEIAIPDTQVSTELAIGENRFTVRSMGNDSSGAIVEDCLITESDELSIESDFLLPDKIAIGCNEYNITAIASSVISGQKAKSIDMPEFLFYIDNGNFNDFSELEDLNFKSGVAYIGASCFNRLSSLASLKLPEYLHSIAGNCFNYGAWESVEFPKTLSYVGNGCFRNNSRLKTVVLNENLLSIGKNLFNGCDNLTTVRLSMPPSAKEEQSIEECFNECPAIEEIYFDTPYVRLVNSFKDVDKSQCVLYVPEGTLESFQKIYPEFVNIREFKSDKWDNDNSVVSEIMTEDESNLKYYNLSGIRINDINTLNKGEMYILNTPTGTQKRIKTHY